MTFLSFCSVSFLVGVEATTVVLEPSSVIVVRPNILSGDDRDKSGEDGERGRRASLKGIPSQSSTQFKPSSLGVHEASPSFEYTPSIKIPFAF